MMLQSAFTVALHVRALSEGRRARKVENIATFSFAIVLCALIGVSHDRMLPAGHNSGEFVYRLFLSFYGLIFPAYVWLFMIPNRGSRACSARAKWIAFGIAIAIASPMFWAGFVEGKMIWLLPGVGIGAGVAGGFGGSPEKFKIHRRDAETAEKNMRNDGCEMQRSIPSSNRRLIDFHWQWNTL